MKMKRTANKITGLEKNSFIIKNNVFYLLTFLMLFLENSGGNLHSKYSAEMQFKCNW